MASAKSTIMIRKEEYHRLKKIDERFDDLVSYVAHLMDIREAREEIKKKRIISQERLFKELDLR